MCPHYSLLSVTLASVIVSCRGDSSNIDEDSTCLIQVKHRSHESSVEIPLRTNATLKSPSYNVMEHVVNALDESSFDMPPVWDFETLDAGGLRAHDAHKPHKLHPLWRPEWWRCTRGHALEAGAAIFLAGILCCAGGIGGGGIYVTVLMVFGALSVRDAVPLSKVIVFAASTPSLILNAMKTISVDESESGSEQRSLIDWNLLRIVVPFALVGTLMGVYLNSVLPGKLIVALLSLVLLLLTIMVCRTGYQQHCQEKFDEKAEADKAHSSNPQKSTSPVKGWPEPKSSLQAKENAWETDDNGAKSDARSSWQAMEKARNAADQSVRSIPKSNMQGTDMTTFRPDELTKTEVRLAISALLVIVYCGVLHYYADDCAKDVTNSGACRQPFALIFTFGLMPSLKSTSFIHYMGDLAMTLAILYCTVLGTVATYYIVRNNQVYGSLHKFESIGNRYTRFIIAFYIFMSGATGCLAGLVGIGGGLIFSPVFIQMNIDPHIAVASSATCVIFTSSSTTFQYLFTDRIIVALVFSFCIPHLLAAYTGTKIVHYIQDNYGAKKSWITWIVALGVGISFVLAIQKLFSKHRVAE